MRKVKLVNLLKQKFESDKHFAELVKGAGIAFILRIFGIIAWYTFTFLVTRTLGAEAWGIFALSLVMLQIASVIGKLGMDTVLLRFTAEYVAKKQIYTLKEIYKKSLTVVFPTSILISLITYFFSPYLAIKVFNKPNLEQYFKMISLFIFPFILLSIYAEGIRGLKKIRQYMLLQQTGLFVLTLFFFIVGLLIHKSNSLPILSFGFAIIVLVLTAYRLWKKYMRQMFFNTLPHKCLSTQATGYLEIFSISIPMLLSSSLGLVMNWIDTLMLAMFKSTQEVGIYNVALKISMITSFMLTAINTIAAPKFAELWGKRDLKGLSKLVYQSTGLIFWSSFPILIIILSFPEQILEIFGDKFKDGSNALVILTIGQFVNAAAGSVNWILNMTGNQVIVQFNIICATILNIILNFLLIPKYGMTGAAVASMLSTFYWNTAGVLFIKKKLNLITFYFPREIISKIRKIFVLIMILILIKGSYASSIRMIPHPLYGKLEFFFNSKELISQSYNLRVWKSLNEIRIKKAINILGANISIEKIKGTLLYFQKDSSLM